MIWKACKYFVKFIIWLYSSHSLLELGKRYKPLDAPRAGRVKRKERRTNHGDQTSNTKSSEVRLAHRAGVHTVSGGSAAACVQSRRR